jgi:hypothetical protein
MSISNAQSIAFTALRAVWYGSMLDVMLLKPEKVPIEAMQSTPAVLISASYHNSLLARRSLA